MGTITQPPEPSPHDLWPHAAAAGQVRAFARTYEVAVWFVAHPRQQRSTVGRGGKLPVPTMYDISGSAHWYNKADVGICLERWGTCSPVLASHRPLKGCCGWCW